MLPPNQAPGHRTKKKGWLSYVPTKSRGQTSDRNRVNRMKKNLRKKTYEIKPAKKTNRTQVYERFLLPSNHSHARSLRRRRSIPSPPPLDPFAAALAHQSRHRYALSDLASTPPSCDTEFTASAADVFARVRVPASPPHRSSSTSPACCCSALASLVGRLWNPRFGLRAKPPPLRRERGLPISAVVDHQRDGQSTQLVGSSPSLIHSGSGHRRYVLLVIYWCRLIPFSLCKKAILHTPRRRCSPSRPSPYRDVHG